MSINMESQTEEYADYHVQNIGFKLVMTGDESADYIHNTEAVSDRGIDSDELAELVAMYRSVNVKVFAEQEGGQAEPGSIRAEGAMGINLGPDELPTRTSAGGEDVTNDPATVPINDQTGGKLFLTNYEEPGVLDVHRTTSKLGFEGAGGGGGGNVPGLSERFINFRDNFGTGPFLDRTDDLSLQLEITEKNAAPEVDMEVEVSYFLYWDIHEQPEGRASFARP